MSIPKSCVLIALILISFLLGSALAAEESPASPVVLSMVVDGTVNAALADFIVKGIEKAENMDAKALIIQLDTPGGMVSVTKKIIKTMENSKVPVVVYVAPSGSSAASAGALITMAADVAVMSPGTNIGAAHPVASGGENIPTTMAEKVMNDLISYMRGIVAKKGRNTDWLEKAIRESVSVTAEEARDLKVVDFTANSLPDLLKQLDGRQVTKNNTTITLHTKNARVEKIKPGLRFRILDVIAHPNVAYILMIVGMLGIIAEVTHPGAIFPGIVGGICILLAFFASQVLPVNYVGVMLILLSIIMFILELKMTSYGMLAIGGVVSFVLGSVMLFDSGETAMRISYSIIIPTAVIVSLFFLVAMSLVIKSQVKRSRTGVQGLVGEVGVALTDLEEEGKVQIHGEYWNAKADRRIPRGERVRVIRADNLYLFVTKDVAG